MTGIRSEHSSFLNALLNTPHFNKEIAINMGATINQITGYMFSKMEFLIPSANEQDEIGEYFKNLDYLITLHQCKYNYLLRLNDCIFSIITKTTWEQRKLGDVVGITSGFMGDSLLSDGKYHLTRIETIADGIVDENRVGYSNEKPDDMYLLKHGDILYSNINSISHMGKVAKYQGNSPLYHGINLLRLQPENNINSDFLLYLLNTEKCRNWAKTRANQAVSQASINQSLLTTQEIAISSFEEQKKIGDYFRNLDNLITLHQCKLKLLKQIKQSMENGLFIKNTTKETVLCAANAYKQIYYLNPLFEKLPEDIKKELKIICVSFTEEIGGIISLEFDKEGSLNIKLIIADEDIYFDEIESGMRISQIQRQKEELFKSLELYYKLLES